MVNVPIVDSLIWERNTTLEGLLCDFSNEPTVGLTVLPYHGVHGQHSGQKQWQYPLT